jgi:hypothetical protein
MQDLTISSLQTFYDTLDGFPAINVDQNFDFLLSAGLLKKIERGKKKG